MTDKMKISESGIAYLKLHEGLRLNAYRDVAGLWTIGYGHLIKLPEEKGLLDYRISLELADKFLREDVQTAEDCVNKAVKVTLTQGQFDALVSFTYNLGCGALNRSTLLALLNKGDYGGAAEQFLRWDKAGGKPWPGLTKRRQQERKMFLED